MKKSFILSLAVLLLSTAFTFATPGPRGYAKHTYSYQLPKSAIKYDKQRVRQSNKNIRAEQKAIAKHSAKRDHHLKHGRKKAAARQQHKIHQHERALRHEKMERREHAHHLHSAKRHYHR